MADDKYEPLAFSTLAGTSVDGLSAEEIERGRAVLAERAQASADALPAWPLEVASYTPQVRAVLDSLVTWRMAWQAWHEMPDEGRDGYEERTAALAAADVADDNLADLADALIAWCQDQAERTAKDAARDARRAESRKWRKDGLKPKERRDE